MSCVGTLARRRSADGLAGAGRVMTSPRPLRRRSGKQVPETGRVPSFGYQTREATVVPWDQVPERNKQLMIAVSTEILAYLRQHVGAIEETPSEHQ